MNTAVTLQLESKTYTLAAAAVGVVFLARASSRARAWPLLGLCSCYFSLVAAGAREGAGTVARQKCRLAAARSSYAIRHSVPGRTSTRASVYKASSNILPQNGHADVSAKKSNGTYAHLRGQSKAESVGTGCKDVPFLDAAVAVHFATSLASRGDDHRTAHFGPA